MVNNEVQKTLCSVMEGRIPRGNLPSPLQLRRMKKQEVLLYEGFPVRSVYYLLEGHCGVSVVDEDGIQTIADVYRPVQIFGVTEYFSGISEFMANVYISSPSALLLECPAEYFFSCVRDCHELSVLLNTYLAGLLARTMSQNTRSAEAPSRYALAEYFYINSIDKDLPHLFPIGRDELSHRLRMNQRTLYRALRRLEQDGLIGNSKGKTVVGEENFRLLERLFTSL